MAWSNDLELYNLSHMSPSLSLKTEHIERQEIFR